MKKVLLKTLLVWACVLSLTAAIAAEKKKSSRPPPGSELSLPARECGYLLAHQPAADVEYRPGVDVHGKPVVEADLTPNVIRPPEVYSFDLTVDVARYIGLSVPQGLLGEAKMGTITVKKGQVKFNGNPLEGDAEAALKAACAAQKPPAKRGQPDGGKPAGTPK